MRDENRFYKGRHPVRVLTKSEGYWIVEAIEEFEDLVNGERIVVKKGERRIAATNLLFKRKALSPPVKEHTYELKMEKKLKHIVEKEENKD
jgi:hypothetical protein